MHAPKTVSGRDQRIGQILGETIAEFGRIDERPLEILEVDLGTLL